MKDFIITIEGRELSITNPGKVLWDNEGITKLDYIKYLLEAAPYLLAYTKDRLLTMIRWPDGIGGKSFYQKEMPDYAPAWIPHTFYGNKKWILLNDAAALVWVANQASLELHLPFNLYMNENYPEELVIDLDPMDTKNYSLVREIALKTREVLDSFGLASVPKTSGATGLQIYVPVDARYTYDEIRSVNKFLAEYISIKNPSKVTLERVIKKRGNLLYFDYLQLWRGRTLPAPYSVRARPLAPVSTPLEWKEVERDIKPGEFNLFTVRERIRKKGDLFDIVTTKKIRQDLDEILAFLKKSDAL